MKVVNTRFTVYEAAIVVVIVAVIVGVTSAATANNDTLTTQQLVANNPGTGHAISAHQNGTSGEVSAANLTSTNPLASVLQVSGVEAGRGSIKVTHSPSASGATDQNAAGLSVWIAGVGTAAQGIHVDSDGTTGALVDIRNGGNPLVKVLSDGRLQLGGAIQVITARTGPPTVNAPNGSLALCQDGTMWLRSGGVWTQK